VSEWGITNGLTERNIIIQLGISERDNALEPRNNAQRPMPVVTMDDPMDVHDELASLTNMTPGQCRNFELYGEEKSGGEELTKPVDDMIRLLETPATDYEDTDDGFNEVEEANQAISFINRMKGNEPGDPIEGTDPPLSKRDMSLYAWGYDPDQNDGFLD